MRADAHLFLLLGQGVAELENLRRSLHNGVRPPPPPAWQDFLQPPVHGGDGNAQCSQYPTQCLRPHLQYTSESPSNVTEAADAFLQISPPKSDPILATQSKDSQGADLLQLLFLCAVQVMLRLPKFAVSVSSLSLNS